MLLASVLGVALSCLSGISNVLSDVFLVFSQALGVHVTKRFTGKSKIADKTITARSGEVLTNDDSHELEILSMWCHCISGHHPSALAQLMGDGELERSQFARKSPKDGGAYLIILMFMLRIQTERNKWKPLTTTLRQDDETKARQFAGKVVGGMRDVSTVVSEASPRGANEWPTSLLLDSRAYPVE